MVVSAVPDAGLNVPRLLSVVKVTTAPDTAAPAAFVTVAFTVTEPDEGKVVVTAPAPSTMLTVTFGLVVVVDPVPDPVPEPPLPEQAIKPPGQLVDPPEVPAAPPPPPPQPATAAAMTSTKAKRIRENKPEANKLRI